MWFAIFDFEYSKDRDSIDLTIKASSSMGETASISGDSKLFMRNPQLYKLGMTGSCFSLPILAYWILYAIWHAFVIYNLNFYALS